MSKIIPYKESEKSKKEQVSLMFDNISPRYDQLNRLMTFGIDIGWRKKSLSFLKDQQLNRLLDVATGTGDFAILASKIVKPKEIIGIDISNGMLDIGKRKILTQKIPHIRLESGDSENIVYPDSYFDAVTVAYGVRNFENLEKGLKEINRVMKQGAKLVILEATSPENKFIKFFYDLYFGKFVPWIGKLVSKDKAAYSYLPESVNNFPQGMQFINKLNEAGFKNTKLVPLLFGASTIYIATK
ncbi:MAG: bifunctional demethylmenaquinone methyltransferase/2-methoxy-6-polyprenyl-1,4-benzoquinol methylase UbiE [Cytophagales bacterium]